MSDYAMFYNSENGDRVYDADSFSNWLKKFFTTGVFEGDCQVTALGDMVVNLAPGYANIMGKVKELENQTFTLEPADGSYPRIDTIVIERNDTDRDITAKVVTGELSGNTPAPTPRVWENGVYQLVIAEIYVAAGATEVTQANITDKRSDPDVCGIVAGTVTEMDFSQFTAQFESYFEQFKASNLEEFSEWFQHMKDQLDTDAAGHLQNEIDDLTGVVTGIGNRVTTLEGNLTASNQTAGVTDVPFRFGCTNDGKFGYIINQGGADTVVPFSGDRDFTMIMTVQIQGTACHEQYSEYNTNPGQGTTKTTNITVTIKRTNGTITRSFNGWDGGYTSSKYNGYVTCRIASITIRSFTWDS